MLKKTIMTSQSISQLNLSNNKQSPISQKYTWNKDDFCIYKSSSGKLLYGDNEETKKNKIFSDIKSYLNLCKPNILPEEITCEDINYKTFNTVLKKISDTAQQSVTKKIDTINSLINSKKEQNGKSKNVLKLYRYINQEVKPDFFKTDNIICSSQITSFCLSDKYYKSNHIILELNVKCWEGLHMSKLFSAYDYNNSYMKNKINFHFFRWNERIVARKTPFKIIGVQDIIDAYEKKTKKIKITFMP